MMTKTFQVPFHFFKDDQVSFPAKGRQPRALPPGSEQDPSIEEDNDNNEEIACECEPKPRSKKSIFSAPMSETQKNGIRDLLKYVAELKKEKQQMYNFIHSFNFI